MRWVVLEKFRQQIEINSIDFSACAVVGGSEQDPEIQYLKSLGEPLKVSYLGVEDTGETFQFFDLNADSKINKTWKLVLCSQVLEHVWHHDNFFLNLSEITQANGYLWLNVPMSNFVHGSPEYYSAGFAPEYLIKNLEAKNYEVISSGLVGSKRYYVATHLLGTWLTEHTHRNPIFNYHFQSGSRLGVLRKFLQEWFNRMPLIFLSKTITSNPRFATESFILARKKS